MKRILLVSLCALLLIPSIALAAGKATVTEETFAKREMLSKWVACEVYAEIENTGDKPIEMDGGLIELFNPEGDVITNEKLHYMYPELLQPGEKGYAYFSKTFTDISDPEQIADYSLTVNAKSAKDSVVRLDTDAVTCGIEERSTYLNYYALTANVINNEENTVRNLRVVFIGRDADGKIMYVDSAEAKNVGLLPGSTIEVKCWVDSLTSYWKDNNAAPASVEAIAYGM